MGNDYATAEKEPCCCCVIQELNRGQTTMGHFDDFHQSSLGAFMKFIKKG
jgi:hypothetical protein